MRRLAIAFAALAAAASFTACTGKTEPPAADAGAPPDDPCNSQMDAQSNSACQLATDGTAITGYIFSSDGGADHDWYHLSLSSVPDRALLQVTASMTAPGSPVTMQVLLFRADGSSLTSVATAVDPKPHGAPSQATLVTKIDQAGDYDVLVQDDAAADGEVHNERRYPYTLTATLQSDSDVNEPNDTPAAATPIALTGGKGTGAGVLATTGDVDVYAVDIPADQALPAARSVLYVGLDVADVGNPPITTRVAYTLSAADGGVLAKGQTASPVGEQKVATAKVLPVGGTYFVTVQGYQSSLTAPVPAGDPRLTYKLDVRLLPEADANEPNDTPDTATAVSLGSPGATQTLQGRLGAIPDPDWFNVTLGSSGQNTRLQYTLSFDDGAGDQKRFPEAGRPDDHQITVSLLAADPISCSDHCAGLQSWIDDGCSRAVPQCIQSYRLQDPEHDGLNNFVGVIPVPAHSGSVSYSVLVEDQGNDGADDRVYTLQLAYLSEDSDDATSTHDTGDKAATVSPGGGSYAADPGNAGAAQAYFGSGHGVSARNQATNDADPIPIYDLITTDPNDTTSTVVFDYDATNDTNFFKMSLPQPAPPALPDGGPVLLGDGGEAVLPLAWSSAWTIPPAPGQDATARPYDLQMTYFFCDPSKNPGCSTSGTWSYISTAYTDAAITPGWVSSDQPAFDFNTGSGRFITRANECFCVEPRFVKGGVMYLAVTGINRTTYADAPYTVNTAFSSYPQSYTGSDGSTHACPTGDGGLPTCHFCDQSGGCQTVTGLHVPRTLP